MQPRKRARVLKIFAVLMVVAFAASLRATCADDRQRETASLAHDILDRRCFSCHGANGVARKNVFVLDRERLVASHTVIPGDSNSLLLKIILARLVNASRSASAAVRPVPIRSF